MTKMIRYYCAVCQCAWGYANVCPTCGWQEGENVSTHAATTINALRAEVARLQGGLERLTADWRERGERLAAEDIDTHTQASAHFYRNGQRWSVLKCADELAALGEGPAPQPTANESCELCSWLHPFGGVCGCSTKGGVAP